MNTLETIIAEVKALAAESAGVAGYHLNGEIATWDEILSGALATLGDAMAETVEYSFQYRYLVDGQPVDSTGFIRYCGNKTEIRCHEGLIQPEWRNHHIGGAYAVKIDVTNIMKTDVLDVYDVRKI